MLAAAIDAKDPYTRGHSERVARYSIGIGKNLSLPEKEMRNLRISALLARRRQDRHRRPHPAQARRAVG